MRIFLITLFCLVSVFAYAEKVIVSYLPDGKVYVTYGQGNYIELNNKAETIVQNSTLLKNLPYEIIDSSQLPSNPDSTLKDRDYWISKKGEAIKIDETKKQADIEASQAKEKALNDKLKAIGLTKEDLKEIIK